MFKQIFNNNVINCHVGSALRNEELMRIHFDKLNVT